MTTLEAPQHTSGLGELAERAVAAAKGLGRLLTQQVMHEPKLYESNHYNSEHFQSTAPEQTTAQE